VAITARAPKPVFWPLGKVLERTSTTCTPPCPARSSTGQTRIGRVRARSATSLRCARTPQASRAGG